MLRNTDKINKHLPKFSYILYILFLTLPCAELALRILGYEPYRQQVFHIEAKPENCIIAHSSLGFALHPGDYGVTINDGLQYDVQHGKDSLRLTSHRVGEQASQDSIYFFGCSYTYGMGVSDSLTFSYLIQQNRPNSYIRNFGVPGYGTTQSYLQLKQLVDAGEIPSRVVINYADFHDDRNALTPAYRRDLFMGFQSSHESVKLKMQQAKVPFIGQVSGVYQLQFCEWTNIYESWKYRETFAVVNFIQDFSDQNKTFAIDKEASTRYLFTKIKSICDSYNIQLLVTGITPSLNTKKTLLDLQKSGIETLDISVELSLSKYTNAPYDDHPNEIAHAVFAHKIIEYLPRLP